MVETARLTRIKRPVALSVLAVLCMVSIGAAFWLGTRFAMQPAAEPAPAPRVLASVEQRVVDSRVSFPGTVQAGIIHDVILPDSGAAPPVVTRMDASAGEYSRYGMLLGVASGLAYIGLPGPLPLYRDLALGDEGEDVLHLQRSLQTLGYAIDANGVVDRATLDANADIFAAIDRPLASTTMIPHRQLLELPGTDHEITEVAGVGTRIDADHPLMRLAITSRTITFRADPVAVERLSPGAVLTVNWSAGTLQGAVADIGAYDDGTSDGRTPGRDVTVTITESMPHDLGVGMTVTVLSEGTAEDSLAVPITALRQDDDGDFVLVSDTSDMAVEPRRVGVTVLHSGDGWAAVAGELSAGEKVVVS